MTDAIQINDITALLSQRWQHVTLRYGRLTCEHCREISKSPKRAMSLEAHLHTILGFVHIHLKCEKP